MPFRSRSRRENSAKYLLACASRESPEYLRSDEPTRLPALPMLVSTHRQHTEGGHDV